MPNITPTITWKAISMDGYPTYQNYTDVVVSVGWKCIGTATVNNFTYTSDVMGCQTVPLPASGSPFIPYDELQETEVLSWVFAAFAPRQKTDIEARVIESINHQANPPLENMPLPW